MIPSIDETNALLKNLSESFSVEVKSWFDPQSPEGKAKLIKAAIALRNNNGGRLVIGFDDESMEPVHETRPPDVRRAFGQDAIQSLVARYASEAFEVRVQYAIKDGTEFPVICVPSGVKTPVATKVEIKNAPKDKPTLPMNTVYVRTLKSNNTVSTAVAGWQDWDRLCGHCFDNREADIGRFVRRHLDEAALPTLAALLAGSVQPAAPDPSTLSTAWLDDGGTAFTAARLRAGHILPKIGFFEIAAVIIGELKEDIAPNRSMLNLIRSANRRFTGLPFFVTMDHAALPEERPQFFADAWEQLCIDLSDDWLSGIVDFWRIEATGRLYAARGFTEDLKEDLKPARVLSVTHPIWLAADALVEAVAVAAAMAKNPQTASLAVTLRWTDLAGRRLSNALSTRFLPVMGSAASDDMAISSFNLPLDLPDSALAQRTTRALAPLYRKFQGWEMPREIVEEEVQLLLSKTY